MFNNFRVHDIRSTAIRHSVPIGAVFTYQDGTGDSYLCLGEYNDEYFLSCKLASVNTIANFTCTPTDSSVANRQCTITGVFNFVLSLGDSPEIMSLSSTNEHTFGSVISLPKCLDNDGNSHLWLTLGNKPSGHIAQQLLLRLTGSGTNDMFKHIPDSSIMAVRGKAALHVEYLES